MASPIPQAWAKFRTPGYRPSHSMQRVPHAPPRPVEPDDGLGRVDARKQRDDRGLGVTARGGERGGRGLLVDARRVAGDPHRAAGAACSSTPAASRTIRTARRRSFALVARTSTMRDPYALPSAIITLVESALSTTFCAVPAVSRVEPASTSGPVSSSITTSAGAPPPRLLTIATVSGAAARGCSG